MIYASALLIKLDLKMRNSMNKTSIFNLYFPSLLMELLLLSPAHSGSISWFMRMELTIYQLTLLCLKLIIMQKSLELRYLRYLFFLHIKREDLDKNFIKPCMSIINKISLIASRSQLRMHQMTSKEFKIISIHKLTSSIIDKSQLCLLSNK